MPWKSKKQAAWGHSKEGVEALGGPWAVKEWDKKTKGRKLMDRVRKRLPKKQKHVNVR